MNLLPASRRWSSRRSSQLVERIRAEGLTVLIVEQNVAQVLRVVDRAYVLEAGRVVAEGTSAQLASDPKIRSAFLGGH